MSQRIQRQSDTKRDDWLVGDDENNTLFGLDGNDRIFGFGGDDTLDGGIGNDTLDGGSGNDFLVGGSGNDRLIDKNGGGTLDGGDGSDLIEIADGRHTVFGGLGDDFIIVEEAVSATISGGDGNDWFSLKEYSGNQNVTIDGGIGHDVLQYMGDYWGRTADIDWSKLTNVEEIQVVADLDWIMTIDDTMFNGTETLTVAAIKTGRNGSAGSFTDFDGSAVTAGSLKLVGVDRFNSNLTGGIRDDILIGMDGSDTLQGGGGDDAVIGGDGDDIAVFSGNFSDYKIEYDRENGFVTVTDMVGGDGKDQLTDIEKIKFADQTIYVEVEGTIFIGTADRDRFEGTDGGDQLFGNSGDDTLRGYRGVDTIEGGAGDDRIMGGYVRDEPDDFFDVILGGAGNDRITDLGGSQIDGGTGKDSIVVRNGSHSIFGGDGNDRIFGEEFVGTANGGEGDDWLVIREFSGLVKGDGGNDRIEFYGPGDVSLYGGVGDDKIAIHSPTTFFVDAGDGDDIIGVMAGYSSTVYGGEGVDTLNTYAVTSKLSFDWGSITGVEQVKLGITNEVDVALEDDMFVNQDAWLIDASDEESRSSIYHYVRIDGSAITEGQLTLIGNNDRVSTLIGGTRDDVLFGLMADDALTGGGGDDQLDGGRGSDVAVFAGNIADYTIVYDNARGVVTVTDNVGDDGTDTLADVEQFRFADAIYNVLLPGNAIRGTGGNDRLIGTEGSDRILGLGGDDMLSGSELHDNLDGGAGNDTLVGGDDDDTLLGGSGRDILRDDKGNGFLDGGTGNDKIVTDSGLQTIFGGDGDDFVSTGRIDGTVDGGLGDDHIITSTLTELVVFGGEGSDVIEFGAQNHYSVYGGDGDDVIWVKHAYQANGLIDGGDGNDILQLDGNAWVWDQIQNFERIRLSSSGNFYSFEASNDMFASRSEWVVDLAQPENAGKTAHSRLNGIQVTTGRLIFIGGDASDDTLIGGALDDQLFGKAGDDSLYGYTGDDTIDGGAGGDVAGYYGNFADFVISYDGTNGEFTVTDTVGEQGTDILSGVEMLSFSDRNYALPVLGRSFAGTARDDKLVGTEGSDTIIGLDGHDVLSGGVGHDHLDGGAGNDRLFGNSGTDTLIGGDGNDTLVDFEGDGSFDGGDGKDSISVEGLSLTVWGGDGDDLISVKGGGYASPFSLPDSILIEGGAGDDVIEIVATGGTILLAGDGDDRIDIRRTGGFENLDGGDGKDSILVSGPSSRWHKMFNIEEILVDTVINNSRFMLDDNLFANRDHWVIKGLDRRAVGPGDNVWINASKVTIGTLNLVGLLDREDTMIGGALDDEISGLSGDDYMGGGGGNDTIDGGFGADTAVFLGEIEDYTITVSGRGIVTVTDNEGTDGTDTLRNVESLQFVDATYEL